MNVDHTFYERIIQDCVAWVEGRGTAFFISSELLLTCTHVVKGQQEVQIQRFGTDRQVTAMVLPGGLPVEDGDLTMLKVADAVPDQPAVLLHMPDPSDLTAERKVILAGYPKDNWATPGGYEPSPATVHPRKSGAAELDMLIIETPANVAPGLSGSPMLDLVTGTVIGITRYRSGKLDTPGGGGGAIPVARAVAHFPEVRSLFQRPPPAAHAWLDRRSREQLQAIGREPRGTVGRLDLCLDGALDEWSVGVEGLDDGQAGPDVIRLDLLGVNVTRAVFQWTRGRRTSSREDLQLAGEILSAALLHGRVGERYRQWRDEADELIVRLITDRRCGELADLPWEYANPRSPGGVSLGVDEKLSIVRVMRGAGQDYSAAPQDEPVEVAIVVVQPDPTTYPVRQAQGELVSWPDVSRLEQAIRAAIPDTFQVRDVMPNQPRSRLETFADQGGSCAILHYQGYVTVTPDRTALAVYDESTGGLRQSMDIYRFADVARRVHAAVVVVEAHAAEASNFSVDDPALHIAAPLLDAGVLAVVTNRSPVHPSQARLFNAGFYKALAAGATVERAAQAGRIRLNFDDSFEDQTAFGAFVLWTGETAGLRLVDPRPSPSAGAEGAVNASPLGYTGPARPGPPSPRDTVG